IVLFILFGTTNSLGSWVGFNVSDLVQKSDVILLGNIDGPVGESKGVADGITGWVTYWRIEATYYLKGDQRTKDVYVVTPGAKNKNVRSSNDYSLDEWGSSSVLLFLRKDGDSYVPLSPQGVVAVEKSGYYHRSDKSLNGKRILAEFTITNPQTNTMGDFENFITTSVPVMPTDASASLPLKIQSSNKLDNIIQNAIHYKMWIIMGVFIMGLTTMVLLFLRHRGKVS
ncbi:MAG: hypothetical protein Q8912_12680, partial [Bacillota bacterium]|nr:hypothetical protein [Bacillota bacterium]